MTNINESNLFTGPTSSQLKEVEAKSKVKILSADEAPGAAEDGITVLQTEEGYLSWFRGYRMQLSMSPEGIGNYGSSPSSMHRDLQTVYNLVQVAYEYSVNALVYLSHTLSALIRYPEIIQELRNTSISELQDFIRLTGDTNGNDIPSNWFTKFESSLKEFTKDELVAITNFKQEIQLNTFDDKPWAVVYASYKYVGLRLLHSDKFTTFLIPENFYRQNLSDDDGKFISLIIAKAILFTRYTEQLTDSKITGHESGRIKASDIMENIS